MAGRYKSVFVGEKLQNTTKLPRVLNVDVAVNTSPLVSFFLKTKVPSTPPAVVLLMNDSRVVYAAMVPILGKVIVGVVIPLTRSDDEADETE